MGNDIRTNPLVLLGAGTVLGTGLTGFQTDVSVAVVAAQSTLPIMIGVGLLVGGWYTNSRDINRFRRTVFIWIGSGILAFFIVGFWFGQVSRLFETSFLLAVVASLSTGAGFGAIVGVYSARLKQSNAELSKKNEQIDQFASVVSHDLRNPLHIARGHIGLATTEETSEHLDPAAEALERMETLIDDLLTLARQGQQVGELEPVTLESLSHHCWGNVDTEQATLVAETKYTVRADRSRLQQLLENLFRNAVEHGGKEVTVTVGDCAGGFYVADNGVGIPKPERDDVLESGYSTTSNGTGLGLSIVTEIAESHGWDVTITESTDTGTRFEITGVEFV